MAWQAGQKAVCVEEPEFFHAPQRMCIGEIWSFDAVRIPVKGAVYLVRAVRGGCKGCGGVRLLLAGMSEDFSFPHAGFRPAVDDAIDRLVILAADPPPLPGESEREREALIETIWPLTYSA